METLPPNLKNNSKSLLNSFSQRVRIRIAFGWNIGAARPAASTPRLCRRVFGSPCPDPRSSGFDARSSPVDRLSRQQRVHVDREDVLKGFADQVFQIELLPGDHQIELSSRVENATELRVDGTVTQTTTRCASVRHMPTTDGIRCERMRPCRCWSIPSRRRPSKVNLVVWLSNIDLPAEPFPNKEEQ